MPDLAPAGGGMQELSEVTLARKWEAMSIYLPFPRHFVRIHNDFWDYLSSEMSCKV